MQALQRNVAVQIADLLRIPPTEAKSRQVRAQSASILRLASGAVPIAEPSTRQTSERSAVTPFNPVDGATRLICALLAGAAATAVLAGTLALMVS